MQTKCKSNIYVNTLSVFLTLSIFMALPVSAQLLLDGAAEEKEESSSFSDSLIKNYKKPNQLAPIPKAKPVSSEPSTPKTSNYIRGNSNKNTKTGDYPKGKQTLPAKKRQAPTAGNYIRGKTNQDFGTTEYPKAAIPYLTKKKMEQIARTSKDKATRDQAEKIASGDGPSESDCIEGLNAKLREIAQKDLDASHKPPKKSDLIGKKTGYLGMLLEDQADISFLKAARAFSKSDLYIRGQISPKESSAINADLAKSFKGQTEGRKTIEEFLKGITSGNTKHDKSFGRVLNALQSVTSNDSPEYRINKADILVLKTLLNERPPSGQTSASLKDRLLNEMRTVFPSREFSKADMKHAESYLSSKPSSSKSPRYDSAKKAFVEKAKSVIKQYVQDMDRGCDKFISLKDGKLTFNTEDSSSCNVATFAKDMFNDPPVSSIESIFNFITTAKLQTKLKQNYIRVKPPKFTVTKCKFMTNQKTGTYMVDVSVDAVNLPIPDKGYPAWYFDIGKNKSLLEGKSGKKKVTISTIIPVGKDIPNSIDIKHDWNTHTEKIVLKDQCTGYPEKEEEDPVLVETPTEDVDEPATEPVEDKEPTVDDLLVEDTEDDEKPKSKSILTKAKAAPKQNAINYPQIYKPMQVPQSSFFRWKSGFK